ncbi:MAG: N-formylglutamate amidohydrolase [Aestuariibacter sp.]|nr:N-formylglutamate amidohydrolase [Aestuariibacter sp.]
MSSLTELLVSDESAALVENPGGKGQVVLICEHAGRQLPGFIDSLGIEESVMSTHIAWDLGAAALSRLLSELLDAPLVLQRYSRLVYDCNRSFEALDAIVEKADGVAIPGNADLSAEQRKQRFDMIYQPFHSAVQDTIAGRSKPVIVTIHSFTPFFQGRQRDFELGILHDADSRLADSLLAQTQLDTAFRTVRNKPYSAADGATHTLITHGVKQSLQNVMFEVRNDLLGDSASISLWARRLSNLINTALDASHGVKSA